MSSLTADRKVKTSVQIFNLFKISWPIIGVQLLQFAIAVVDAVIAGNASSTLLAEMTICVGIYTPFTMFLVGVYSVVSVKVASRLSKIGHSEKKLLLDKFLTYGLLLSLVLGIVVGSLVYSAQFVLPYIEVNPSLHRGISIYLQYFSWSYPLISVFIFLRFFQAGFMLTKPALWALAIGFLVKLILGWWLVLQLNWNSIGLAVSNGVAYFIMLLVIACPLLRADVNYLEMDEEFDSFRSFSLSLLRTGGPSGLIFAMEVGFISAVTLMVGAMSVTNVAAYQVSLSIITIIWSIPLGLSVSISVMIGKKVGENSFSQISPVCHLGIFSGLIAISVAIVILSMNLQAVVNLYSSDPQVFHVVAGIFIAVCLYLLLDSLQTILVACLRALEDTLVPLLIMIFVYWGGVIPLLYFRTELNLTQVFYFLCGGFIVSLTLIAIRLLLVLKHRTNSILLEH